MEAQLLPSERRPVTCSALCSWLHTTITQGTEIVFGVAPYKYCVYMIDPLDYMIDPLDYMVDPLDYMVVVDPLDYVIDHRLCGGQAARRTSNSLQRRTLRRSQYPHVSRRAGNGS